MFCYHGTGSLKLKQFVAYECRNLLAVPQTDIHVQIVRSYKHLGGLIAADGSLGPEVAARCLDQSKAVGAVNKAVLTWPG
eukprot:5534598-Karenia_brevis.AAC.1